MIALYIALNFQVNKFDLLSLPSPAFIEDAVLRRASLSEYNKLLEKSSMQLSLYKQLSFDQKKHAILSWYKTTKADRLRIADSLPRATYLDRKYQLSQAMGNIDLTKLDLLLLFDGKPPQFHTKRWLCEIYNLNLSKNNIDISKNASQFPNIIVQNGSPFIEPGFSCFESFMRVESEIINRWVNNNFDSKYFREMTVQRMIKKTSGFKQ